MAGNQPPDGHQTPKQHPSYAQILSASTTQQHSKTTEFLQPTTTTFIITSEPFIHKGEPTLFITDEEEELLAAPFRLALIAKFAKGRPPMDFLRTNFQTIGFKGSFTLGMIDHCHILIRFAIEEDYHRCWLKSTWNFGSHHMRTLKWTPDFSPIHESSIVPIWVSLEGLPFHMFHTDYLMKHGRMIGKPLKADIPTLTVSRPSVARICLEVDLLKPLPERLRIGKKGKFYFQPLIYENLPAYCLGCQKIGHEEKNCRKGQPVLNMEKQLVTKTLLPQKPSAMWKLKEKESPDATVQQTETNVEVLNSSSSGLSALEKKSIPTAINDMPSLIENKTPHKSDDLAEGVEEVVAKPDVIIGVSVPAENNAILTPMENLTKKIPPTDLNIPEQRTFFEASFSSPLQAPQVGNLLHNPSTIDSALVHIDRHVDAPTNLQFSNPKDGEFTDVSEEENEIEPTAVHTQSNFDLGPAEDVSAVVTQQYELQQNSDAEEEGFKVVKSKKKGDMI